MKWYEWTRYIREECDAPSDVKSFLLCLATYADNEGHCWPAYPTLAEAMGVAISTVQRRRKRAVELGWIRIAGGRWSGDRTHYHLIAKGTDNAHLRRNGKVPTMAQKGTDKRRRKVPTMLTERTSTFQEGDLRAPSLDTARLSQTDQRRYLAKAIREAPSDYLRERFLATFLKEYGHLYREVHAA